MELLLDKYTDRVDPEMGPKMMSNAKYGHMAGMMATDGKGRGHSDYISSGRGVTLFRQDVVG